MDKKLNERIEKVLKVLTMEEIEMDLEISKEDAEKIVKRFEDEGRLDIIDSYPENEDLEWFHYEYTEEDMFNYMFQDDDPYEVMHFSTNMEDYPDVIDLGHVLIRWDELA